MALCLRYLHRHPLELSHLPATAIVDLLAIAAVEAELLNRLPPQSAIALLRRVGDAIATAFGLADFETQVEVKKKPSARAAKR